MRIFHPMRNQKGYSLTEIMVVLAIVGVTGLGTMAMMANVIQTNETLNSKVAISSLKSRIEKNLLSKESWRETIYRASNTAELGCLRENSNLPCNDTGGTPLTNIEWMNRGPTDLEDGGNNLAQDQNLDGTPFFDDRNNTTGFTMNGELCTTFSAAGNDQCPIGVDIQLTFQCRAGFPRCKKPQVTASVIFTYSASTANGIGGRIDFSRFNSTIDMSGDLRQEIVEIKEYSNNGTQTGGGACTPVNTWIKRPLRREIIDSGRNSNFNNANDEFTLQAGIYNCTVQAEVYSAFRGTIFRLMDATNSRSYNIGTGQTNVGQSVVVTGSAEIRSTVDFTLSLETRCFTPSQGNFDMGIPKPNYNQNPDLGFGSNTFTLIRCVRLN